MAFEGRPDKACSIDGVNRFLEYYSNAPEIETPSMNDRRSEREPKGRKDHGSAREKTERKAEKGYTACS